ncbi:hypothetical protein Aoki45_06000 [Algoriphagus sp. oki45]|uniref:hypothetical protein n=1 Tax=Algoriphagus sp. oki45 TaxID=3067294 RepID=UPI0027EC0C40|nr:hypothetical protein Aoki45_06000 [Algoriphagus sp. oki45]
MIDMDPGTLIVSTLFMAAFIAPFVYHNIKSKKVVTQQNDSFNSLAGQSGAKPEVRERWRNIYQIGLDRDKKILVYQRYGEKPMESAVDLKKISKVSVEEKAHTVVVEKEKRVILDYLALNLYPKDKEQGPISLEFYDGELFTDLLGERLLANQWKSNLDQLITH